MSELPPPDLLDHRGRLNRLVIALLVGAACAAASYALCYSLAGNDYEQGAAYGDTHRASAAGRFIFYFTGLAFVIGGSITHVLLDRRAKRRDLERSIPTAQVRRD